MPVDRELAADLARDLVDLYADLETRIGADLARRIRSGMDAPDWAERKMAAVATLRRWLQTVLARVDADAEGLVGQALMLAYIRGSTTALDEIARLQLTPDERALLGRRRGLLARLLDWLTGGPARRADQIADELQTVKTELPGVEAMLALMYHLRTTLTGTHLRILRWSLDAYRDTVAAGAADVLAGVASRRRAAQVVWERLLAQGITGFTDKAGRRWELASYVEMATRTTVAQAAISGHLDRIRDAGVDLVRVSDSPQECARCRPWEHKILSISGSTSGRVQLEHATIDGRMVTVHVAGSFAQAVAAGLFHPNCTHSVAMYLPGLTQLRSEEETADPTGDADRRELRALERKLRRAKRDAAAAIDPAARRAAEARVRQLQADIRDHVDATGLLRQRHREQIGMAR